MAERAGMLRSVTVEMQSEVDSQNRLLDSMVRARARRGGADGARGTARD